MKILFVEDELSKNIPRIVRIFAKYLGSDRIKKLEALDEDESGYGAGSAEIKKIVEESKIVEVEYQFPEALHKIINGSSNYALFIVDRNLSLNKYGFNEIAKVDDQFSDHLYNTFFEREGDYLLQKLVYSGTDVLSKFYFLTAYSAEDELRNGAEIKMHIDFGKFTKNNFIEKGNDKHLERLNYIIENNSIINLRAENIQYLNILGENINFGIAEKFLQVLSDLDNKNRIGDNLNVIRIIYDSILQICSEKIPNMKESCVDNNGKIKHGKITIDWLTNNNYFNSILRNFYFSFRRICSDFGSHENIKKEKIYKPTLDTVAALVFALKDSILWLNEICGRYE